MSQTSPGNWINKRGLATSATKAAREDPDRSQYREPISKPTCRSRRQEAGAPIPCRVFLVAGGGEADFTRAFSRSYAGPSGIVVVTEQKETSITLHGLPPGEHQFKVAGLNSSGAGAESIIITVQIAAAAA